MDPFGPTSVGCQEVCVGREGWSEGFLVDLVRALGRLAPFDFRGNCFYFAGGVEVYVQGGRATRYWLGLCFHHGIEATLWVKSLEWYGLSEGLGPFDARNGGDQSDVSIRVYRSNPDPKAFPAGMHSLILAQSLETSVGVCEGARELGVLCHLNVVAHSCRLSYCGALLGSGVDDDVTSSCKKEVVDPIGAEAPN